MASQKLLVIAALALYALCAQAQEAFPNRPLRIIVGFSPGGGPDVTARHIAQKLGEAWKQPVIVENRPGAGGTVAAALVARAPADGYTLLSVSSAHAAAAAIYGSLPYDTLKDFAGITQSATSKYVLVAPPSLEVRSLEQLLARARAQPGKLNFSSAGVGSGTHFAAEIFKSMAGIDVVHVPNKGIPEALGELVAGRVQFFMAPIANAVGPVKGRQVIGLGVSSLKRDPLLPDVPTIDEAGVAGYDSVLWFGILAPGATPTPIKAKLSAAIAQILGDAETRARWAPIGIEPQPTTPEGFDAIVRRDVALFTRIARTAGIKAN
jgi:tripartite-type tricarboxylate transporter receptor subunit TctC